MIATTVGRVVWYYIYVPGQGHKGPLAAHVCKVHSDRLVNVMLINESGEPIGCLNVHLAQDNEEAPQADYCCWMPYQKGQAAKTEALERQVVGS